MKIQSHLIDIRSLVFFAFLFSLATASMAQDKNSDPLEQQGLGISDDFGKWKDGDITWVYNSTDAPAGRTDTTTMANFLQAAFDEWGGVCGVNFTFGGIDNSADPDNLADGIVPVVWDATIAPAAGRAGPVWNGAQDLTGPGHFEYTDGRIWLNPAIFATDGLSPDSVINNDLSLNQTVVHEVGHMLGLGHSSDPISLMFANPYNSLDQVRDDDIDSCRAMYGYSDLYGGEDLHVPEAAGTTATDILFLAAFSDFDTQITIDDGTLAGTDTLAVRWQITQGGYAEDIRQTVVDPAGFTSIVADTSVVSPQGGAFGIASFNRLREYPGVWTVYVTDSTGNIGTMTLDVQTAMPAGIENPGAAITYTENPSTRATSVTVDVTSVSAAAVTPNQVTVDWHIGTQGVTTETLAVPGQSTQNVTFADTEPHEVHVEVTDDQPRYTEDVANNIGPAGDGFQTLLPYFSSPLNHGSDGGGDNSSDILLVNPVTGGVFFWNMHGNLIDPRGAVAVLSDLNWSVVGRGDYNGDGKADILWRHAMTQQLYYWEMDGSRIESSAPVATLSSADWSVIGDGDYNGDGLADIMFRNASTGQIFLWQMNGSTISSAAQVAIVSDTDWQVVGDKDADSDGIADLMWFNATTGQVYFWKMNGSTITSAAQVAIVSDLNWSVVEDGDYNGDGNADLIWRHAVSGKVYYWQMSGSTIQLSSRIAIVGDLNWQVAGRGDYNGDGFADILWFNTSTRQIYHWQQDGFTTLRSGQISSALDADWQIVQVN